MFTFPKIRTTRTDREQAKKIIEEIREFEEESGIDGDKEAVDIWHACETFIRIRFKSRRDQLRKMVKQTIVKNKVRHYYTKTGFY